MGHATQNIGVTLAMKARSCGLNDPTNSNETIISDSKNRMSRGGRLFKLVHKTRSYMNTMLSYPQPSNSINAPGYNS